MSARSVVVVLLATLSLALGLRLSAQGQEDVAFVEDSAFVDPMRPPVPFRHDAHNEGAGIEDCTVCHHLYQDGKRSETESSEDRECSECHAKGREGDRLALASVYHQRCKGCHQQAKAGPVQCSECHPR
jgi:hypothetical protein